MQVLTLRGRSIMKGSCRAEALVTRQAFMFAHGLDPGTGVISDRRHELRGHCVKGKVFVFPYGKGSTTGSTWLLETIRLGNAPAAILNVETEPIIATGLIMGELLYGKTVPCMDRLNRDPTTAIHTGDIVEVKSAEGLVRVFPRPRGAQKSRSTLAG